MSPTPELYYERGTAFFNTRNWHFAVEYLLEAYKHYATLDPKRAAECLYMLSLSAFVEEQSSESKSYMLEAINQYAQNNLTHRMPSAYLATALMTDSIWDGGLRNEYADMFRSKVKENKGNPHTVSMFLDTAIVLGLLGDLSEGIKAMKDAVQLYRDIDEQTLLALSLYNLGCFYFDTEQFMEAYESMKEAYKLFDMVGLRVEYIDSLRCLGDITERLGYTEESENYYQEFDKLQDQIYELN